MRRSIMSTPRIAVRFVAHPLVALMAAGVVNGVGGS
jgi:hypothetical protein